MPRGGARKGGGRPTKAEELGLPALIDSVIGVAGKRKLIEIMYKKAAKSYPHLQLLSAYAFGKPTETKKIEMDPETIRIVREVVTGKAQ